MNGQQRAVLWIGLILVGLNLVSHWKEIVGVIFTGSGITGGIGSGSSSSSGGGLQFPTLPLPGLPLIGSQKTSKVTIM
jgi:hypothetical protein